MAKKKTNKKTVKPAGPLEWIYEMDQEKNLRNIYDLLKDNTDYMVEYWQDAGVLEISFEPEGGIDMEQSEEDDVLWVTVSPKAYEEAMDSMKKIESICGGKFSVDQ